MTTTARISTFIHVGLAVALTLTSASAAAAKTPRSACGTRAECAKKQKEAARAEALAAARAADIKTSLEAADAERGVILARARARLEDGDPAGATARLEDAAADHDDAILAVEAATMALEIAGSDGVTRARVDVTTAREMLAAVPDFEAPATLDPDTARVDASEVPALLRRCDAIEGAAQALERRGRARARLQKRGRQEFRTGVVIATVGLGGLGLLVGGVGVESDRDRKLAAIRGHEGEYDLTSLNDQHGRANTMIAAGAVVGAIGLAVGTALIVAGRRNLKRGGGDDRRASLRVAPSLGGVVIGGRF